MTHSKLAKAPMKKSWVTKKNPPRVASAMCKAVSAFACAIVAGIVAAPAYAATSWTNWNAPSNDASGYPYEFTLPGGSFTNDALGDYTLSITGTVADPNNSDSPVGITMEGEVRQGSFGNNTTVNSYAWGSGNNPAYFFLGMPSTTENPTQTGYVQPVHSKKVTIRFDAPVTNPVLAIASLGSGATTAKMLFSRKFAILSKSTQLTASTSANGYELSGTEGIGTIQLCGTFDSSTPLEYTITAPETWFTVSVGLTDYKEPTIDNNSCGSDVSIDGVNPTLVSSLPTDDATGVSLDSSITLTFSEDISDAGGTIKLYKSGGTLVETFTNFSISGATVTLNPSSDLDAGTGYYIQISSDAFTDSSGNAYAGISDTATLNFSTTTSPEYSYIDLCGVVNQTPSIAAAEYPIGTSTGNTGSGITFTTCAYSSGTMGSVMLNGSLTSLVDNGASLPTNITIDIPDITGQKTVYALLNNYFGTLDANEYQFAVNFTDGTSVSFDAIGGTDTRDFNQNIATSNSVGANTTAWWTNYTSGSTSYQRLDVRQFDISAHANKTVTSVTLTQVHPKDTVMLSGLTFTVNRMGALIDGDPSVDGVSSGKVVNGSSDLTLTLPASMQGNTTSYQVLANTGTTPSVSGTISGDVRVTLSVDAGTIAITSTAGLTAPTGYTTAQWSGATELSFIGSLADVNAALATLQHKGPAATISGSVSSADAFYLASTGSYYQFIPFNGSFKTWAESLADARTKTLNGLTGYLAHVTTQEEKDFLVAKAGLGTPAWLGGYASNSSNLWIWSREASSPDSGQAFWSGVARGTAQNGFYDGFCANEPNSGFQGEPYLQISHLSGGCYNDLAGNNSTGSYAPQGYFVEFTPDLNSTNTASAQTNVLGDAVAPVITGPDGSGGTTTGSASAITVDENQTAVTQFGATDNITSAANIAWSASGDDAAKFDIASDGTITFKAAPDFENPTDIGDTASNNTYVVIVTATDEAGNSTTQALTVTVRQVYYPGEPLPEGTDQDGDGVADAVESATADRDGDGIVDAQDYDPQGYFYCQADGRILTGGKVSITGPGNINLVKDGSSGQYQWFVDAPGTYTMAIDTSGMEFDTIAQSSAGSMTIASFSGNPVVIGSTQNADTGYLGQFNGTDYDPANPTAYYTSFVIAEGDPNVFGNNIPFDGCAMNEVQVSATTQGVEPNDASTQDAVFTVSMDRVSDVDTIVTYTLSGTATAGADYTAPSGTVTIPAGQTSATVSIAILDDELSEGAETIVLTLTAISAGDSATVLAASPAATVQIIEDLIDQIRDDLTEILNNDMRGAIDGQQAVISQTSKSALARLRAGNDTTGFCGDQTAPDTTGGATASAKAVDINAAQSTNTYDCVSGTWIKRDASMRVTKTDGAGVQYNLGYSVQRERFVSDTEVRGSFLGAYASRSNVSGKADGSIRGVGVNGGIFGAQDLAQGYLFDYYLGGSLGAHTFDLQFPTAGLAIDADGRYTYGALMSGAAIGREAEKDEMVLLPRVGFDAILAKSLKGSVDASQGSLTDSASIQLDDYRKVRVFGELELTGPLSNKIDFAGIEREWTYAITPRVICDRVWPASSFECGYAATLSVAGYDNSKGITTSIDLTGEDVGNTRSIRLSASHRKEIMDGAGAFVTTLGGTQDGNVSVGQSLNINF